MPMSDSQWYPCNIYLINNVMKIVDVLGLTLIIPICFPAVEMRKCARQMEIFLVLFRGNVIDYIEIKTDGDIPCIVQGK